MRRRWLRRLENRSRTAQRTIKDADVIRCSGYWRVAFEALSRPSRIPPPTRTGVTTRRLATPPAPPEPRRPGGPPPPRGPPKHDHAVPLLPDRLAQQRQRLGGVRRAAAR